MTSNNGRIECSDSIVFVATRSASFGRGGTIGYFESPDILEGWALADQCEMDISDIMESVRTDKAGALRMMNAHWQGY